jgi:hypothetical protein
VSEHMYPYRNFGSWRLGSKWPARQLDVVITKSDVLTRYHSMWNIFLANFCLRVILTDLKSSEDEMKGNPARPREAR